MRARHSSAAARIAGSGVARALQHRRQQRLRGDAQRRGGRLRVALADHLREQREARARRPAARPRRAPAGRGLRAGRERGCPGTPDRRAAAPGRAGPPDARSRRDRRARARPVPARPRGRPSPARSGWCAGHPDWDATPRAPAATRCRARPARAPAGAASARAAGPLRISSCSQSTASREASQLPIAPCTSARSRRPARSCVDERAQVGAAHADARAEVDDRGDGSGQAQPARIRPLQHEQHGAGQRHRGVEDDALQESAHAPAQADRHRVVEQRAHGGRQRVVEGLAADARRDRRRPGRSGRPGLRRRRASGRDGPGSRRGRRAAGSGTASPRSRTGSRPGSRPRGRHRRRSRGPRASRSCGRRSPSTGTGRGRARAPCRARRPASSRASGELPEVAGGALQAGDRGLVRFLQLERAPAPQRTAREAQQQRRSGEQHGPGVDQRDRRQARGRRPP